MSWGKLHSPFETFWLFCLLVLNSEVWKFSWILCSFELVLLFLCFLPPASWFCLLFLLDTQKWVLDWKAALGIMPNEPLRSLTIVVILPMLYAGQRQPFSLGILLSPASLPCVLPCSHLGRGGVMWAMAGPGCSQGSGCGQSRSMRLWPPGTGAGWGDKLPPGAGAACVRPLAHPAKGLFFHLSQPQQT